MGSSAYATLFYGFTFADCDESIFDSSGVVLDPECYIEDLPWINEEEADPAADAEQYFLDKAGVVYWNGRDKDWDRYDAEKKAVLDSVGCGIGHHGYGHVPQYYVYCVGSEVNVSAGSQVALDHSFLVIGDGWDAKLKSFCEELGIPYQFPLWNFVSSYG